MADLSKKIANSQNLIVLCPKSKQFAAHVFCTVNTTLGRRIASWQEASLIPPLTQPLGPPHSFQNVEHLRKARSRLKRDRFLQTNTDFADLLGVDKLCTYALFCTAPTPEILQISSKFILFFEISFLGPASMNIPRNLAKINLKICATMVRCFEILNIFKS